MKRIVCLVIFCVCSLSIFAQSFSLRADATKVIQNSSFEVKYTLDGAKGSGFITPDFGPFEVVGGPRQSSSMQIINGAMSQNQSFSYDLYATKIGKFKVPGTSIVVNGKKLNSNSLAIEVVKGKAANQVAESDKESFMKLETTAEEAIIGQQITVEYKLYTQQDVNGYDLANEPDYDGFFSQELRNYRAEVTRQVLNGKEYYTKVLKKVALFPQRTGRFDFSPVTVTLAIPIPGAKKNRGFFSNVPTRQKRIKTNSLTILVNDAPPGAPISFSGAVGKYQMAAKINKNRVTTDDAFVINMEVRGTGDGKTFSAPKQRTIEHMEYYDPNVVRDEDTSRDGIVSNYKQIEYLIVPKKPGTYNLQPEFSYYDTDSMKYMTIRTSPFRVQVTQGTRSVIADDRDVSITQNLEKDRTEVNSISSFQLKFFDGLWFGSFGIGFLAFLAIGYKKYRAVLLENLDPEEKRRRKAMKLANSKLEKAREHQHAGDSRKFYEEISSTMNGYLGNRFGLPNTDFQKEKIVDRLSSNGASQDMIDSYLSILKTCEMALFAGQPSSKMDEILDQSTDLILKLEE
ncbi:MAG: hypothetical protein ACJA1A_002301 [Saprospiraceae bacterium]|jgi:hypothetical protein